MCRSLSWSVAAALSLVVSGLVASTEAASSPTGTVSCIGVQGKLSFGARGLSTPTDAAPPHVTKTQIKSALSADCDNSGVMGGRFPITEVLVSLNGRLAEGETCGDFFGTLDFEKTKLTARWRGDNNGRVQTVASSKATVASATWDSGSERVIIVTSPIVHGAFAGSTLTFRMSPPPNLETSCMEVSGAYTGIVFGTDGTSTITVP